MKGTIKKNIILILLFGFHLILNGQPKTEINSTALPFENINLFTDRDIYLSGENIWFSASVNLDNNQTAVSNVLFLELFNTNQRSIVRKKYKINNAFSEGVLEIPAEFLSGVYYLRAYTHYNKNFPAKSYFLSALQIINTKKGIPYTTETIISKETSSDSLSNYTIGTPQPKNGMQYVSVDKTMTNINSEELQSLELADFEYQIISKADFALTNNPIQIAFPDSTFTKPGLYYFLLKDKQNKILKVHAFIFNWSTTPDSKPKLSPNTFNKRDLVEIDLNNYSTENNSYHGFKIVQKGCVMSDYEKLMLFMGEPHLLFSFLKTQFNPLNLSIKEVNQSLSALNNTLNTEEYKRLFNQPIVSELKWIPGKRENGLGGIIVDKLSQKPVSNIPIYLSFFDDRPQIHITISKGDGSFQFDLNSFENYKNALLCPLTKKIDQFEIKVNREFSTDFPHLNPIPLRIDSTFTELIEDMLIASQTSKDSKIKSNQQDFSIYNLPYSFDDPEITVVLDDFINTPTLEMVFEELVPSVRIRKQKGEYTLSVFDIEREILYKNPLVMVDDVPIFNIGGMLKIPPKAIEKIEVHNTPFQIDSYYIEGIVLISTLTDNFGGMNIHKSSSFFKYQTLSPNYSFSVKNYKSTEYLNSRTGNFRTLLFWDPIKENPNQEIKLYTSDLTGTYDAYIFGKTENGQVFQTKIFDLMVKE